MVNNNRREKAGNLANAYRPDNTPRKMFERGQGLDWDSIMRHGDPEKGYKPLPPSRQLTLEELDRSNRGLQNHYGDEARKQSSSKGGKKSRPAPFDVEQVVRLYSEDKMGVSAIALQVGSSPETVRKYLKKRGVYESTRDKHRPIRTADSYSKDGKCKRGHDVTKPGARYPSGACRECSRERALEKRKGGDSSYPGWDHDPRNPKSPTYKPESAARRAEAQIERNKKKRLACPQDGCGHAGKKHTEAGCKVRVCRCNASHDSLVAYWASR